MEMVLTWTEVLQAYWMPGLEICNVSREFNLYQEFKQMAPR